MRLRQEILTIILTESFRVGINPGNSLNPQALEKAGLLKDVNRTWKRLGGLPSEIPLKFGNWDIVLKDFIVELDEEQHFNRYRKITLDSSIYNLNCGFNLTEYINYCSQYEIDCLKKSNWGKYWTNPSSEKQFGNPGKNGNLEALGSPRWKQRAFFDYIRDVCGIFYKIPVVRISIYDKIFIDGWPMTISNLLYRRHSTFSKAMVTYIEQKVNDYYDIA